MIDILIVVFGWLLLDYIVFRREIQCFIWIVRSVEELGEPQKCDTGYRWNTDLGLLYLSSDNIVTLYSCGSWLVTPIKGFGLSTIYRKLATEELNKLIPETAEEQPG